MVQNFSTAILRIFLVDALSASIREPAKLDSRDGRDQPERDLTTTHLELTVLVRHFSLEVSAS
jgi:hypothetical protein